MTEDLFEWRNKQQAKREKQVATAKRDAGVSRAAIAAGDNWRTYAIAFLKRYLQTHATMFVDDLWRAGLAEPKSPRALGAVIQHASRFGWCVQVKTADGCIAARPSVRSNMQLKPVWRSQLFSGATA